MFAVCIAYFRFLRGLGLDDISKTLHPVAVSER